jgi:hypothetical protein
VAAGEAPVIDRLLLAAAALGVVAAILFGYYVWWLA